MGDFFHGWRRKAGCVTLVMAMIFASGWTRSLSAIDTFRISTIRYDTFICFSTSGEIWCKRMPSNYGPPAIRWYSEERLDYRIESLKSYYGIKPNDSGIPYWSIVVPFILLSAYLLLWPDKRRERKAKAPVEDK